MSQEVRLTAAGTDTGWITPSFSRYTHHKLAFDAPGGQVTVSVEVRGRWGLRNNGFFLDALSLEPAGAGAATVGPGSTPAGAGPKEVPSGAGGLPAWETLSEAQRWEVVRELGRRAGLVR